MIELTDPKPEDNYLNLCCGTGTLLIERALRAPTTFSCGIEINRRMLQATKTNLAAARVTAHIARMDVHNIGISPIFNAMTVDLPYGGAIGSHTHNTKLYPAILHAAARASRRGAVLVALTSHIRLLENAIASQRVWTTATFYRVYQGGLRPAIYVLTR
jgi:23S rRNA G2445 N2-methylase RlmL